MNPIETRLNLISDLLTCVFGSYSAAPSVVLEYARDPPMLSDLRATMFKFTTNICDDDEFYRRVDNAFDAKVGDCCLVNYCRYKGAPSDFEITLIKTSRPHNRGWVIVFNNMVQDTTTIPPELEYPTFPLNYWDGILDVDAAHISMEWLSQYDLGLININEIGYSQGVFDGVDIQSYIIEYSSVIGQPYTVLSRLWDDGFPGIFSFSRNAEIIFQYGNYPVIADLKFDDGVAISE